MKKFTPFLSATLLLLPALASAQFGGPLSGTEGLISELMNIVSDLLILVAAVALLVFFWGLAKFILKIGGDAGAVEEGKNLMKWGLIALFVMVSVWGIIRFFQDELGLDTRTMNIGGLIRY